MGIYFNVSFKRVGALRFLKIGRLSVSWTIARQYKPFKQSRALNIPDSLVLDL